MRFALCCIAGLARKRQIILYCVICGLICVEIALSLILLCTGVVIYI